jgi:hypothetical protein
MERRGSPRTPSESPGPGVKVAKGTPGSPGQRAVEEILREKALEAQKALTRAMEATRSKPAQQTPSPGEAVPKGSPQAANHSILTDSYADRPLPGPPPRPEGTRDDGVVANGSARHVPAGEDVEEEAAGGDRRDSRSPERGRKPKKHKHKKHKGRDKEGRHKRARRDQSDVDEADSPVRSRDGKPRATASVDPE